jgi:hypothetical protein
MFFEENQVNDTLNCDKCQDRVDDPRILPCGDTVCSRCLLTIHLNNNQFKCFLCDENHFLPQDGFPVNKKVLKFLSLKPTEIYRSTAVEKLKEKLSIILKDISLLRFDVNNGIDTLKESCREIRNQVQLATEQAIQQINERAKNFKQK